MGVAGDSELDLTSGLVYLRTMTFLQLEKKKNNKLFVYDSSLNFELPPKLDRTWGFSSEFLKHGTIFAQAVAESQEISDVAGPFLDEYKKNSTRIKTCLDTYKICDINKKNFKLIELVPKNILIDFGDTINKITDYVLDNNKIQSYYKNLMEICEIVDDIKSRKVNFVSDEETELFTKLKKNKKMIYTVFSGKTYRLGTGHNSFPMNLKKEWRSLIVPENHLIADLDFNGMDIRIFIGLLGKEQPETDIHLFNQELLGTRDRNETKLKFFSWFYDETKTNIKLDSYYDRHFLLDKYVDKDYTILTPYDKQVKSDSFHCLNHLIQTTASFVFWEQAYKVFNKLRNKKTFIKFLNHDSIVLDIHKDELELLKELQDIFSQTNKFGKFKTTLKVSERWGKQ